MTDLTALEVAIGALLGLIALAGIVFGGRAVTWKNAAGAEKARGDAQEALARERAATIEEERQRLASATAQITDLKARPDMEQVVVLLNASQARDEARAQEAVAKVVSTASKEHQALLDEARKVSAVLGEIHRALKKQNGRR